MEIIDSLEDLAAVVQLRDIRYQELSARRTGAPAPPKPVDINLPMSLNVAWNDEHSGFAAIFKASIELPHAEFVIAVSVHFHVGEPAEVSEDVMGPFLGDTVFNLAYPYIRQAASMLSSQLRISPIIMLPLMKGGVTEEMRPAAEEGDDSEH